MLASIPNELNLPSHLAEYAGVIAIGLLASAAVLLLGWKLSNWALAPASVDHGQASAPAFDPFTFGSPRDRRAAVRRKGNTVEVLLTAVDDESRSFSGWVLDRSVSGLGLVLSQPVSIGTLLNIRPKDAPAETAWLQIEVRNCTKSDDRWLVGCSFVQIPSFSVLLLFG
jgi:hypothetical protein